MKNSNKQRGEPLPSELAKLLDLEVEAIKHQGGRLAGVAPGDVGKRSVEIVGENNGMNYKKVMRYIRLNSLVPELIDMVDIATPHIAGYSYRGKQNGTASAVCSVARHFGISELYGFYPLNDRPEYEPVKLDLTGMKQGEIAALFQYNYPVFTDDFRFRMEPGNFEKMRSAYQYRREVLIEGL